MVNPFFYSPHVINALERALSPERLSTYLAAANGDHAAALRLYVWNTETAPLFTARCRLWRFSSAMLFTATSPPSMDSPGTTIRGCR